MKRLAAPLLWTFASLGLVAAEADAAPLKPSDFAYGLELERFESPPVHSFELPESVLLAVVDRQLGDVCVFDDAGRQLAHGFHRAGAEPPVQEVDVQSYYPLEVQRAEHTGDVEVTVQRDPNGAITRAYSRSVVAENRRVEGYLVDLTKLLARASVDALSLSLESEQPYNVEAIVEASDDLAHFHALGHGTLTYLAREGEQLRRDQLAFTTTRSPYLRVTLVEPPAGLRLTGIRARTRSLADVTERQFIELQGEALSSADEQLFAYRIEGAFTPDRYDLGLPSSTPLVEAALESAPEEAGPYRELDRALFRRDESEPRPLPSTEDRFFRLRVAAKGGGVREGAPALRLGYTPPRVLFAAEQTSNYLLAYGSGAARCKAFSERELLKDRVGTPLRDTVRVTGTRTLSGKAALAKPSEPQSLRKYVLWAVLLVAVAGLALMATKLARKV